MKISYNAWKAYIECPKKYFLEYRKKQPSPVPENKYFTLYGKLTEKFFEMYCNIWRYKTPYLPPEEVEHKLRILYKNILDQTIVDWTAPFVTADEDEIFNQSLGDILTILNDVNSNNLFLNTKAETKIEIATKMGATITGRLDFIHKDPISNRVLIFDGKGTNKLGKNISRNQLLFYALLYYFHFKILPEKLGFFYYRFNILKPVPISLSILNDFRTIISSGVEEMMTLSEFKATPSYKACLYCDYQTICQECMDDRASRKKPSKLDIPEGDGIINISF
jgi:hypothetical protein